MPTHYSDDYERITGNPVPADAHPRLSPEPLNNRLGDLPAAEVKAITVAETKDVKPAAVETK